MASREIYHRDAGSAETHILVMVRGHATDCGQVVTDTLPQSPGSGAVEYADTLRTELYGIVNEICNSLQSLIGSHAPDIYLLLEIKLAVA